MAAEKRFAFRSAWLPWVLLAPQVAVIAIFFFWPAAQALVQSLQRQDAFGLSVDQRRELSARLVQTAGAKFSWSGVARELIDAGTGQTESLRRP